MDLFHVPVEAEVLRQVNFYWSVFCSLISGNAPKQISVFGLITEWCCSQNTLFWKPSLCEITCYLIPLHVFMPSVENVTNLEPTSLTLVSNVVKTLQRLPRFWCFFSLKHNLDCKGKKKNVAWMRVFHSLPCKILLTSYIYACVYNVRNALYSV